MTTTQILQTFVVKTNTALVFDDLAERTRGSAEPKIALDYIHYSALARTYRREAKRALAQLKRIAPSKED